MNTGDGAFTALRSRDYRQYLFGQVFANTGAWIQSIALDWLVLRLTGSATAVGLTMALQFTPILLLGVHGGALADSRPKRQLLLATQAANALLACALAVLTIRGVISSAQVYVFALLSGLVFAVDGPARSAFVTEVVPPARLRAAISTSAAAFQSTRLIGPAIAGVLIGSIGIGWAFAVNALCYVAPTIALIRLRHLRPQPPAAREPSAVRATVGYVLARPRLAWTLFLVGVVGTFGLNFPVVLTAFASRTFSGGAGLYGVFNIALAVGSVAGALAAGTFGRRRLRDIVGAGALFGAAQAMAALAPGIVAFVALLAALGFVNLLFQAMANSAVQLWVEPAIRGRVMGLYLLVFVGGTPIGAPLVGAVTTSFGPRVGMLLCGLTPLLAAAGIVAVHRSAVRMSPLSGHFGA